MPKGEPHYEFAPLPVAEIDVSHLNVRKSKVTEGIDELAQSIREIGLQQPIVVFKKGKRYEVIIGQRRLLAYKKLGRKEIPALVRRVSDEVEAALISFSENIHRLDLEYRDKMRVAQHLLTVLGSERAVADRLGVSEGTVRNYLGYEAVPESVKRLVDRGRLGAVTAVRIARGIGDPARAEAIARKVVEAPSSDRRRQIINIARENPDKEADEVVRLAGRLGRKLTLHLTPSVHSALSSAADDYNAEPEDIAQDALEEWLRRHGFLK